jgi:hypothetical protein
MGSRSPGTLSVCARAVPDASSPEAAMEASHLNIALPLLPEQHTLAVLRMRTEDKGVEETPGGIGSIADLCE